jgi:hypothetical protein
MLKNIIEERGWLQLCALTAFSVGFGVWVAMAVKWLF